MNNLKIYDVIIVGAGPAGSNTAISYKNMNPELEVAIFDKSMKPVTVTAVLTENYPTPAGRPFNSRMDCTTTQETFGLMRPDWRIGLRAIFRDLKEIK